MYIYLYHRLKYILNYMYFFFMCTNVVNEYVSDLRNYIFVHYIQTVQNNTKKNQQRPTERIFHLPQLKSNQMTDLLCIIKTVFSSSFMHYLHMTYIFLSSSVPKMIFVCSYCGEYIIITIIIFYV